MDKKLMTKHKKATTDTASDLFPQDTASTRILLERAKRMAGHEIKKLENTDLIMYIKFRLGPHENYGIPFFSIKEVLSKPQITNLPRAPDYIVGVINRRGLLITVINLKKYFRLAEAANTKFNNIIILEDKNCMLGVLADEIDGIDKYDQIQMNTEYSSIGVIKAEYIIGLHNGVTTILRSDKIIKDIELDCQKLEK